MPKLEQHNFHVPLSKDLYQSLRSLSESAGRPATALAREAIEQYVQQQREAQLDAEIREYARAEAGTEADLMPEFEAAALEGWKRL